ncbi:heme/hemin ABC transporter substrate-binding protein [Acidomonas methanolica]|uniref:Hemin-binding periplasmic protein HmuT n=1 Tax=Acidomonas methanolica NBRC 104435 TaxID=1231351 RepID=A0A023D9G4_ACIMT|nr:ABC transporter substrate-binding protein [Acidomonas methanolica]TCS26495.1 iron complex transport system substrate-binding protein [Acidomonas methanolica]GAJ30456.1 Hemin-binding periplasmic protein HmuT [Acidomonas methanolica NBRC 104435]GEK99245.1 hemin ABC transporter substrate-binding protein [Acidomonas methanolica NBRC 104435]
MSTRLLRRRTLGRATMGALLVSAPPLRLLAATGPATRLTDARGRHVIPGPARRIACIGGTITETLYDLGAADRIVAVDTTSTRPPAALREKKSLGYMRTISAEGVLSLQPDLILAMNDAGPPTAMDQLIASTLPVVFVDATPSPDAILERTRFLARLIDAEKAGDALGASIEARFHDLAAWRAAHPVARRVLFIMRMTNGHPMAAGTGTAADAVIRLAGAINAGGSMQGYKIVEDEALITLQPDIVLTMAQGADQIRTALGADPGFRLTPAGRRGTIIAMEGERLLGFGPHTPDAALDLARMIAAASPA